MPYIKQEDRKHLKPTVLPRNVGELNYLITSLCHRYLQRNGLRYANINAVIGVLECAKLELYRMIAAPYENGKQMENGSISALDEDS